MIPESLAPGHFFLSQCTLWALGQDNYTTGLLETLSYEAQKLSLAAGTITTKYQIV